MFTRKQYMNNECTHQEYYAQFVTQRVKQLVEREIGMTRLLRSDDPYFNDIPLRRWDNLSDNFEMPKEKLLECRDFASLAGKVCTLKQAARMLLEEHNQAAS